MQEANAIGTAWLRCDLLSAADCAAVRADLKLYVVARVGFYYKVEPVERERTLTEAAALQARIWPVLIETARQNPALANVLLTPFNEMFDLQATRTAAARRHMPVMLLVLLLTSSLVSMAAVGYGCGVAGKRNALLTTALVFLVSGTLGRS